MTKEQLRQDSADLIAEVCREVGGIGPSKGYAIAEFYNCNWYGFLKADKEAILQIKKSNNRPIVSDEQAKVLVKNKLEYAGLPDVKSVWVYLIGKRFLTSQIEMLREVSVSNLDINPFLMKVLNLKTPGEILEFNLYQTVTRSIVTSWGSAVEALLSHCGAAKFEGKNDGGRAGRKPDIQKQAKGKINFIQIKSGPNTMNVDMVNSLNEVIAQYKEKHPNAKFLLGMTYGKRSRISTQIRDNLVDFDHSTLIGRELWDFVSDEKQFHKKVFRILDNSSINITKKTFSNLLSEQLKVLTIEWNKNFGGKSIDEVFENYI